MDFAEASEPPRMVDRTPATSGMPPVEAAFAPPEGQTWSRVDSAFTWYRKLLAALVAVPVAVLGGTALGIWQGWPWGAVCALAALAAGATAWFGAARIRDSWGYAEGRSDFLIVSGIVVRQLVVVPYGRMQVVDVTSNLLEQTLGIATVRVRTAATTADARIPGLSLEDATALRDRLAARSETFSTGL
ncbi:hypothetical protein Nans01_17030 [Nocardiopsis ansamitocini]|uniref:YdbS-like PH domain-containing protein n=1 Tax=Nocardiopsis ansamitocini TaxID=1670832 RepID=A0A9W6P5A5_9ACTN|nr:hypothetical protein Nans01_17030 [Nocardiopsis ansamitocini]